MPELKAGVGRCEEASPQSHSHYIPCNAPAVKMVGYKHSEEGPYRMCEPCAWHNIKNRNGVDRGPYEGPDPTALLRASVAADEDLSAYAADAQDTPQQAANILAQITNTAAELRLAQADVKQAEEVLKGCQDRVRVLETITLPALMDEAQQDKLRTQDGWDIERGSKLRASIPPASLPEAIMWLKANNQGSIVKQEVKVNFGRGEEQKAAETVDTLLEAGLTPSNKMFVHPQTLEATLRELLADGIDVPLGMFGAYNQDFVRMKEAKRK